MHCQVLGTRITKGGMKIAHVSAGGFFGDVPADDEITGPCNAFLRFRLVAFNGRIEARIQVLPFPPRESQA